MQRIDRSNGSIERKRQNISAVMVDLGLPRIEGYLPAKNYQALLLEAVDACLNVNTELRDLLEGQNPIPGSRELVFDHSPPPARPRRPPAGDQVTRIIRKFDPAQRDARNRELGTAGEELVFESERRRLHDRGQPGLSKQVRWIAQDDDGAGFDILSFSRDGAARWLEVKTTNGQAPHALLPDGQRGTSVQGESGQVSAHPRVRLPEGAPCLLPEAPSGSPGRSDGPGLQGRDSATIRAQAGGRLVVSSRSRASP